MRGSAVVTVAILCAGLPSRGAAAEEITIQAKQELELWHDTDLDESVADERVDFYLGYGLFSVQSTFLVHQPTDFQRLDPSDFGEPFEGVRKRMVEARVGPAVAQLGDVYTTMGRGVALQLIENQVVDFDNTVDGFRLQWTDPRYRLEAVAGRNAYGVREASLKAGSARWTGLSGLESALHVVQVDSSDDAAGRERGRDRMHGGELSYQTDWGDVFGIYMVRDFTAGGVEPPSFPQGHAGYGAMSVYWGPLAVTLEGKDYLRYENAYTIPSPVARQHTTTLLNRTSHTVYANADDERGYQAEALLNVDRADVEISLGRAAGETHDETFPYFENYGQAEWRAGERLVLLGRAGETEETVDEGTKIVFFERFTFGGNLYWSLSDSWSFEVDAETQGRKESELANADYTFPLEVRDNIITANLYHSPWLALAATVEWTDDSREATQHWIFTEANFQVLDRHQINVGGGSFRGGQLCSGGICRPIAPFTGLRINWLTTF
jgi:hypothetical protein